MVIFLSTRIEPMRTTMQTARIGSCQAAGLNGPTSLPATGFQLASGVRK
jgi:hypothetical protein